MSGTNGSGLFKNQAPIVAHLASGQHGILGEIANVRKDVLAVMKPLVAVTIEEYLAPPAAAAAGILAVTASATTTQTYPVSVVLSPPRNVTVTSAGTTATDAPASVTVNGVDAQGNPLSETITGTNGGAATYSGIKCFAKVTSIVTPAAAATDATISVGYGAVVGLTQTPKLRAGQTLGLVRREVVDGGVVTTGVLTTVAAHPPYGAYTPAAAPNGTHNYCIEYEYDASLQKNT